MKNTRQPERGLWAWGLVRFCVAASLLLFGALYYFSGLNEEGTRQVIRWSARISAVLFSMAFAASAFQRLFKNVFSFWWLMNRKYLGVSFAIVHLLHLCFLLLLQQYFHPVFNLAKTSSLVGGGLAYLFIVLMLLTSFSVFAKYISRQSWKILHTAGGYWIWFIFMKSYWKRAATESEYIPLAVLLAAVLALRLLALKPNRVLKRAL
ncbi:MAG: hypothetical protein ACE5FF_12120 [Saprospiraceae bacterium]